MLKPTPPKAAQPSQATQPPSTLRWLELSLYVALIAYLLHRYITVVPAYIDENCKGACKNYLKPGWMLGRRVDLTDHQWRVFRGNMPVLTGLALGHLLLSHFVRRLYAGADLAKQAQARLVFYAASAIVFVAGLHGIFALHVFVLVLGNYVLSKSLGSARFAPAIIWVYNLAVLFGIEWLADIKFVYLLGPSFEYLDSYSGFYRWHVSFNLVVLRMISFSMDHYWALQKQQGSPSSVVDEKTDKVSWTYEERVAAPQPLNVYNVWMYMAYLFYMPLHIAGPTITFNAFASQVHNPPDYIKPKQVIWYAVRVVIGLFMMEFLLHKVHCYAATQYGIYKSFPIDVLGVLGYFCLHLLWLKLYIIWRFFRLWALADNIDTVENMNRCMSNNFNLQGFWRSWHRSFNRWLIRYVYIPLGGSKHQMQKFFNTFVVFTFTALWHGLSWHLLVWGWLIAFFVIPEQLLSWYFNRPSMAGIRSQWYYRHICALGAAINIFFMSVSNLIGFFIGVDNMKEALGSMFMGENIFPLFVIILTFFGAAHIMFEWRAYEVRTNRAKDF